MNNAQIRHMVDRFLSWKLPEHFSPDGGITFKPTFNDHLPQPMRHEPIGTNLFTATQATKMVEHMLEGLPPVFGADDMAELRRWWAQEDENRREHARRVAADNEDRRRALAKAFGLDPAEEPEIAAPHIPGPTIEEKRERLKALTALLDYPKPAPTDKPVLFDWATLKVRRNRKAVLDADRIAREEARALADQIRQEIQDYDDALILLLLAA